MKVLFEKAGIDDAKELLEIQKKSFQQALMLYEDYETNPVFESLDIITYKINNHKFFKIIAENNIIGGIHVYKKGDGHYYLNRVFVHPNYENLGIGKAAMIFIENNKEFEDASIWTLNTPHKSYKNHYLYEKMGYTRTGYEEKISDKLILIHYSKKIEK